MRALLSALVVTLLLGCPGGGVEPDGGADPDAGTTVDAGLLPLAINATGYAVVVQGDKVAVVGSGGASDDVRFPDAFVVRVNADLTLDGSLAGRGYTQVDFDGGTMGLQSFTTDGLFAAIADGDKLVATGFARGIPTVPAGATFIARFNADGTLDTTFNTRGYALFDFNPASHVDNAAAGYALARRPDGKYVFAGGLENGATRGSDMFAYRINADGSVDTSFTPMALDFGGSESASDVVLQGDRVVLGGGDFTLCRLNADGSLDTSFGSMGSVKSAGGAMSKLLERPDGRLLAIGIRSAGSDDVRLKLFQVSADGVADATFGTAGVVELGGGAMMSPAGDLRGAALLPDGSALVLSHNLQGSLLYKLRADGTLDTSWGTNGRKPSGLRINILSLITAQPRGSNALTVSGSDAYVTGSTLVDFAPGDVRARFALTKVGL